MTIDTDIRDQAYQFFIQEAPELLQVIEAELLTLKTERSIAKVHNMMRAAHSIKGGAASVGLETIKTLAHSVEDIFKALYSEELEIDDELESLLLEAYDCLRLPLMEQITTGQFNSNQAMSAAESVFAQLEVRLGDFMGDSANIPSSVELGVDIALSIFEVDVEQGLERLKAVLADSQGTEVAGELRAQAETFAGLAELLNLPGFGEIANSTLSALDAHPDRAIQIAQLALADFSAARAAVIDGDRLRGGEPSTALVALATAANTDVLEVAPEESVGWRSLNDISTDSEVETIQTLHDLVGRGMDEMPPLDYTDANFFASAEEVTIPSTDNIFDNFVLDNSPEISVSPQELHDTVEQAAASPVTEQFSAVPSLDDVFGDFAFNVEPAVEPIPTTSSPPEKLHSNKIKRVHDQENVQESVQTIEQIFDSLPLIETISTPTDDLATKVPAAANLVTTEQQKTEVTTPAAVTAQLSVRVDLERLERMNNTVGELAINRNGLTLQNQQLQTTVQELLRRFTKFQELGDRLRDRSDQMLVAPERYGRISSSNGATEINSNIPSISKVVSGQADFDSLEMDSYGELYSLLQGTLEEIVRLEETVGDVVLLTGQSSETIEQQRQMMGHLRDDLMWARMLPLGEVLNRFPRMLRDLSTSYQKPVNLKLSGTGVLVDKVAIEKLNDPLMHLLRNAFDHGIEMPEIRSQQGKRPQGQIEIRAYHQGSQTVIEVRDDGRGLNMERIGNRAIEMGLLSKEQVAVASRNRLLELIFEPGFSTASQVSELSGRGVGLDVVRSQLRSLKGTITIASEPGQGTTFTLRIPLTLTIAKLLVGIAGATVFALPSDSIAEIVVPKLGQVKQAGRQRFLHWQDQIIPAYRLSELLNYACPLPEIVSSQVLESVPSPEDWESPMLLLSQDDQILALEIDRLVTEQELVIKPLGSAIAPPSYIYGCTILADGSLVPVINGADLLNSFLGESKTAIATNLSDASVFGLREYSTTSNATPEEIVSQSSVTPPQDRLPLQTIKAPTLLVVDDSIALRQTLALTLQKAGYRVLQARDGREAIEQLQQNVTVQLVVCDIEMPNMNGFEFLSHRRQDPQLSTIPVVMLTSRSSDKHRKLAMHLGANNYFTKPYIEQEFLAALKGIIMPQAEAVPALSH